MGEGNKRKAKSEGSRIGRGQGRGVDGWQQDGRQGSSRNKDVGAVSGDDGYNSRCRSAGSIPGLGMMRCGSSGQQRRYTQDTGLRAPGAEVVDRRKVGKADD